MDVTIRPAQADEAGAVLALWAEADAEPTHTDDVASIQQLIAHDPEALIVAETDGRIVGSVIAGWDGWRGSIYRLAVSPSVRRRGLGRELVRQAEKRLAGLGAVRLQAIVVDADPRATGFWGSSDWEPRAGQRRYTRG